MRKKKMLYVCLFWGIFNFVACIHILKLFLDMPCFWIFFISLKIIPKKILTLLKDNDNGMISSIDQSKSYRNPKQRGWYTVAYVLGCIQFLLIAGVLYRYFPLLDTFLLASESRCLGVICFPINTLYKLTDTLSASTN